MLRRLFDRLGQWLRGTPRQEPPPPAPPAPPPMRADRGAALRPPANARAALHAKTARITAAFDSSHPVRQPRDLHGRADKLDTLFDAVLINRQHAIIHGARGSGKTSLAQVFGDYADQQSAVVIYAACEAGASFADLLRPYFGFIPDSCVPFTEKTQFERDRAALAGHFGPREVVDFLSRLSPDRQIIMIIDEFDRVEDPGVDRQVATLMKLLSDAQVPVQLIVVGIAHTLDELINCHPSLRRHLVPIPIGRILQRDVMALIDAGAARARIAFDDAVKTRIVSLACGSPYHAQLFCYASAVEAVKQDGDAVDLETFHRGLRRACDAWAMLNRDDHERFQALASARAGDVARAELAAREAAAKDSLRPEEATAQLLGEALMQVGSDGRAVFRDSTAPQFLLAMIALERAQLGVEGHTNGSTPAGGEEPSTPLSVAV
ncbi:MAG: ATP-binding protein [Sphingomonas sp.]